MSILVLGKGYISGKIEKYWDIDEELIRVSRSEYDYLDKDILNSLLDNYKPKFVINAYGFTGKPNVDSCEDHVEECRERNIYDSIHICSIIGEKDIPCINISTGCLYNDENGCVFNEDDKHNFGVGNPTASVYSKSKSEFESKFINYCIFGQGSDAEPVRQYLLRIRMPFDDEMDDKNYINKIIKYDKLINYPNSVTYVYDLVKFIETIIEKEVPRGIYNVVNKNPIKAEDVIEIWNQVTENDKQIDKWYSVDDLLSMGLMKCRRSNCVLSTEKIEKYYPALIDSRIAVREAINMWKMKSDCGSYYSERVW